MKKGEKAKNELKNLIIWYPFKELNSVWVSTSFKESLKTHFLTSAFFFLAKRRKKCKKVEKKKNLKTAKRKNFNQLSAVLSTQNLVKIHNRWADRQIQYKGG